MYSCNEGMIVVQLLVVGATPRLLYSILRLLLEKGLQPSSLRICRPFFIFVDVIPNEEKGCEHFSCLLLHTRSVAAKKSCTARTLLRSRSAKK